MNVSAYYRSALAGLRYVEHQRATGRRFGSDADARWKALQGALTTTDRIDLLIRDADAQWPGAFGPRTVFNFDSVAEDEPFGAPWPGMRAVDAEELWRAAIKQDGPNTPKSLFGEVAGAWDEKLAAHDAGKIGPADKLIVVGPSAIAALVDVFAKAENLDWVDQVVSIATTPAHRLQGFKGSSRMQPTGSLGVQRNTVAVQRPPQKGAELFAAGLRELALGIMELGKGHVFVLLVNFWLWIEGGQHDGALRHRRAAPSCWLGGWEGLFEGAGA